MKTIDNLEGEIWKPVVGYEGLYEVSNMGRVKAVEAILNQYISDGYSFVKIDGRPKSVHQLVGKAFIPNLSNKETINHKNFDKNDNRVENLEWMTPDENLQHYQNSHRKEAKIIQMLDLNDNIIKTFNSLKEASKWVFEEKMTSDTLTQITNKIYRCCHYVIKNQTSYGYNWKFRDFERVVYIPRKQRRF